MAHYNITGTVVADGEVTIEDTDDVLISEERLHQFAIETSGGIINVFPKFGGQSDYSPVAVLTLPDNDGLTVGQVQLVNVTGWKIESTGEDVDYIINGMSRYGNR